MNKKLKPGDVFIVAKDDKNPVYNQTIWRATRKAVPYYNYDVSANLIWSGKKNIDTTENAFRYDEVRLLEEYEKKALLQLNGLEYE